MTYVAAEARQELLDDVASAVEDLGSAIADLGAVYELLDERAADRLEAEVFRPVQTAYGRAQRTHSGFAERFGLRAASFATPPPANPARGAQVLLARALEAVDRADLRLSELQDSMRPVEVGDPELRAGLSQVRELLGTVRGAARQLGRTLGR